METKKKMFYEDCAISVLLETTDNRVLKNALIRMSGRTPVFEVGDKVVIVYVENFDRALATITKKIRTKDGFRYSVKFDSGYEVEGFSGDDMELDDRTSADKFREIIRAIAEGNPKKQSE